VAAALGKDWSTMGGIIDRLEQHALIARHPNPADRRARQLYLTQAGAALLDASREGMDAVQRRMLEVLSPEDQRVFQALLAKTVWAYNEQSRFPVIAPRSLEAEPPR
jgi:DNA-binding MarR family transcriptional regulator